MGSPFVRDGCLTVSQIARRYGKTTAYVYRLIREKGLPAKMPRGSSRGMYAVESDLARWEKEEMWP